MIWKSNQTRYSILQRMIIFKSLNDFLQWKWINGIFPNRLEKIISEYGIGWYMIENN